MVRLLGDPGDDTSWETYRQRWKAETVMSVAERRWGESLSARLDDTQRAQALLRGLVYNLNRLVTLGDPAWGLRRSKLAPVAPARIFYGINRLWRRPQHAEIAHRSHAVPGGEVIL